jgi:hypothetical protein
MKPLAVHVRVGRVVWQGGTRDDTWDMAATLERAIEAAVRGPQDGVKRAQAANDGGRAALDAVAEAIVARVPAVSREAGSK